MFDRFQESNDGANNYLFVDPISSIACEFSFRVFGFDDEEQPAIVFGVMCAPTGEDDVPGRGEDTVVFVLMNGG